jgi:transaldolase
MRLDALHQHGQSVWLDDLDRPLLDSGEFARLIEAGVTGLTSNPSTFAKALSAGAAYRSRVPRGLAPLPAYEALTVADVQAAADLLRPVHDQTRGRDGLVSLEVSPRLAADPVATVDEARRLWLALARPNVMIKVPGTVACLPAITQLVGEGINVNVTLLFSPERCAAVAEAWLAGLERRAHAGHPVDGIASVASFFVSRIDARVDAGLDRLAAGRPGLEADYRALRGCVAIALAATAYAQFLARLRTPRWAALERVGAAPQRLLWASTAPKDPARRDVVYVESLLAPDTVTTLPRATLRAFLDHGEAAAPLDPGAAVHAATLAKLAALGIELPVIARELEVDGIDRFVQAWDEALQAVARLADGREDAPS